MLRISLTSQTAITSTPRSVTSGFSVPPTGVDFSASPAGPWICVLSRRPGRPAELDEFAAAGITSVEDVLEPFEQRLFFGCEADDPLVGLAFGLDLEGTPATLRPILGSDVSHWDAPVMGDVVVEAYELLEHGTLTPEQFRAFTFENPVRLHGGANPRFFDGTPVASDAAAVLGGTT